MPLRSVGLGRINRSAMRPCEGGRLAEGPDLKPTPMPNVTNLTMPAADPRSWSAATVGNISASAHPTIVPLHRRLDIN